MLIQLILDDVTAGLPLPYKYESLLAETLFSQMLRVPAPAHKPVAYGALMVDLCKLLPTFPRSMSACVRECFARWVSGRGMPVQRHKSQLPWNISKLHICQRVLRLVVGCFGWLLYPLHIRRTILCIRPDRLKDVDLQVSNLASHSYPSVSRTASRTRTQGCGRSWRNGSCIFLPIEIFILLFKVNNSLHFSRPG